ncbi:MAG: DNA polymerase III subunit beta [Chloroflexi bacterium]|nr:DNA polymerase III subunit beta [Chloroflexota bacterium]
MRVSCLQENLAKGLAIVSRAVAARTTMPVLGNILLEAKNNQLRLAATNREIGINCWIGAKVEDEGAITVPARLLSDFINKLPPERIDLELIVRTQTLHLNCARYDANMKGIDAYEFPLIPTASREPESTSMVQVTDGVHIELELSGLRKMIEQVIFAASTDENRPVWSGVEVSFKNNRLTMAASDGNRLSVRSLPLDREQGLETLTVIVPAKNLGELARISADADETHLVQVFVTQARNQILFQLWGKSQANKGAFHRVELVSELIDARYPDYQAIIPKNRTTRTIVDTAALFNAVDVAYLFARDNANIVHLAIRPHQGQSGQIRLTATSLEMGDNVNEIDAFVEGNGVEIAFSAKYLLDVLSHIDQPQVVIETTQHTRAVTIRPVGLDEEEFLHVVMPMHRPNR